MAKSGSEWNAHDINNWLLKRGHRVKVMTSMQNNDNYEYGGIHVFSRPRDWYFHHEWADIIFTQLDFAGDVAMDCKQSKKPAVWFDHNTFMYSSVRTHRSLNVVYNSYWNEQVCKYENAGFVLQPPVDIAHYRVQKGDKITLINLNKNKGAEMLYRIAEAMPDKQFLAVQGGYGQQIYKELPNVSYLANQADIRNAYRQTKILLMPSQYESWGRTATEAMASGIPVICSDLPGLRENCADAGTYCKPDRLDEWVKAINYVEENYEICSNKALQRAEELNPESNLLKFEQWLISLI